MADWHLRELEHRLLQRGCLVVEFREAEQIQVATTWELTRGETRLLLDFHVDPDLSVRRPENSYAVYVRGRPGCDLYLGRKATAARPNRSWEQDLAAFVEALDEPGA